MPGQMVLFQGFHRLEAEWNTKDKNHKWDTDTVIVFSFYTTKGTPNWPKFCHFSETYAKLGTKFEMTNVHNLLYPCAQTRKSVSSQIRINVEVSIILRHHLNWVMSTLKMNFGPNRRMCTVLNCAFMHMDTVISIHHTMDAPIHHLTGIREMTDKWSDGSRLTDQFCKSVFWQGDSNTS